LEVVTRQSQGENLAPAPGLPEVREMDLGS
jgi:hypothetical protein